MKRNALVLIFLFMLCAATAQQPVSFITEATNDASANTFEQTKTKAERGDASAQFDLGNFYFKATNFVLAVQWFQKSAQQGLAAAQSQLGIFYQNGYGVPRDNEQAAKWFSKAAHQGDKVGQTMLGICYDLGQGVPLNEVEAYKWLSLATSRE